KITNKNLQQVKKFIKDHPAIPVKWYVKKDFMLQEKVKESDLPEFVHIYSDPENKARGRFRDVIAKDFSVSEEDYREYSGLFDYFGSKDTLQIKREVMAFCSGDTDNKACAEDKAMWWLTLMWAIQKTRSFGYDDAVYKEIKELWEGRIPDSKKKWLKTNAAILDGRLMGSSHITRKILAKIDKLAPFTSVPVIFYGQTGTGKELLSSLLHLRSRRTGKFVAINCAGLPVDILESVLFGVKGGHFTDVPKDKEGLVKEADGGTLFLDEIAEMPLVVQAKLLRFIQFGTYRMLGDSKEKHVDVRIVAATNADLREKVKAGEFREDLLYRLAGEEIEIPPLKDRKGDIDDIANRYYMEFCRQNKMPHRFLKEEEIAELKKYDWPGNIRQLQRVIRKAVIYKGAAVD
ncbi:MAG TPA: sigma 54-interacting transcriptional regulator, partial [Candidatus Goldiibacteriota bacterium]|nr:sigma 54-interacting transcriptional regulator [Candidatus Goldiibacteriota bacterium]